MISNSTINGNSADESGGGIFCENVSSPAVINCTITGNSAGEGGGIYCRSSSSSEIVNTILWNDSASNGREIFLLEASSLIVSFSDVDGGPAAVAAGPDCTINWGEGNIDAVPFFVGADDYHLTAGSPCIDTGTDAGVYSDIDGDERPSGRGFDIGSDEIVSDSASLTRINLLGPPNFATLSELPTFTWTADGGTSNVYSLDIGFSATGPFRTYKSIYTTEWVMPPILWRVLPTGKEIYWRVFGTDMDQVPSVEVFSEETWIFFKATN